MRHGGRAFGSLRQRGVTLFGLMFWAIVVGFLALIGMRVLPTLNEYFTIQRAVNKIATEGDHRSRDPERLREAKGYRILDNLHRGKDLQITKENEKVVIQFAYDKEIEVVNPVFILIKYEGRSK